MVVNEGNKVYVRDSQGGWERGTLVDVKTHTRFNEDSVSGESERNGSIVVLVMMDSDEGGTPREVEVSEKDVKEYGGIGLPMSGSEEGAEDECGVDDMSRLEQLHEASIMYNLRKRFNAKRPYTLISNIVVAVNPYEWREELYGPGVMARHCVCESENTIRSSPEVIEEKVGWFPHVYSVSAAAYSGLIKMGHNQTILVSGESGSGKTETCRLLLNHLACLAGEERLPGARRNSLTRNAEAIIRSTPLLESFGNAHTTRNDNSSRFGKYMQLQFQASRLVGSRVSTYLLEKSRVVRHGPGERTFHVFYELMSAPLKVLQQLSLTPETSAHELHYLNMGGRGEGGESSDFLRTSAALKLIGVAEPMHVWEVVAAIAMLGDISFVGSDSDVLCTPAPSSDFATPAKLLGLNAEELSWQLTHRAVKVSGDTIDVPLSCDAAVEARDGMAKEVYQKVFEMLVNMVNIKCSANTPTEELGHVSLLDIFGFECFGENNFEQFCINYANEKLQQTFTQDVLKLSQIEYEAEEIGWHHIEFEDNAPILEMLEAPKTGILSLLDEECNIPRGTVRGFANKTVHSFKGLRLQVPQRHRGVPSSDNSFTIMHYAGDVTYETVGWLDKNRDVFREDMLSLLCRSENSIVFSAFNVPPVMTSPTKSKPRKGGLMHETVGSKFRCQLQSLTSELGCTHLQYVRCIKPNDYKSPDDFNGGMVAHQLRSAGLVAAVKVVRSAFPSRIPHQDFLSRFSILCSKEFCQNLAKLSSSRDRCSLIMTHLLDSDDCSLYAIGKSIVYLGSKAVQRLEQRRESLRAERGALVASVVSTVIMRKRFLLLRSAVITIQSFARANRAKRRIREICVKKLASQKKEAKVPLKAGKSSGNSSITVYAPQDAGGSVELLEERMNNNDENMLRTGADHPTSILRKGPQKKGTRKKMNLCLDITEVDTNNVPVAENGGINNVHHLSLPSNKGAAAPSKFKPSSPRKTRKEHFMHLNEAHVNEALLLNRIGFVLSAFPSSTGTLKCRVYRERGVLRGKDIYRLYTDPMGKSMEQFLLAAKRLPSSVVRGAYYSMYSKGNIGEQQCDPKAKSVHLGEVRAKSRYNTEFEAFQTTSGTRQELAAISYPTAGSFEALESDRNKVTKPKENEPIDTPRMIEVALPCIETELDCRSDDGTTKTNHHDAGGISLMRYLKSGGMGNDNNRFKEQQPFLLQNRQPRWSPQDRRYVLNFQGRVKMTSVKNFQLVCQGDTDEKIRLQFGRVSRDEFTLDFSWPLSPVQALAIAITSFDCS